MRLAGLGIALAAGLSLSACTTLSDYCSDSPLVCVLAAKAVVGGVILVATAEDEAPASDIRLKQDVEYLTTLDNGLRLYTYSYLGSEDVFVGVMAQELLADRRFAHAVSVNAEGFYVVDYSALGLGLHNADAMIEAGTKAMRLAS